MGNKTLFTDTNVKVMEVDEHKLKIQKRQGAIITVPYDKEGYVYLRKQSYGALGKVYSVLKGYGGLYEFISDEIKDRLTSLGFEIVVWNKMGFVYTDLGFHNEKVTIYSCLIKANKDVERYFLKGISKHDLVKIDATNIDEMILSNDIICSQTVAALYQFKVNREFLGSMVAWNTSLKKKLE
ncbi:hypothetical protein D3C81_07580 [compost metagenome]